LLGYGAHRVIDKLCEDVIEDPEVAMNRSFWLRRSGKA
jgi:hypothetical protein